MIEGANPFSALVSIARRQRVLILVVTALVTVGAFVWALAQPTVFAASSRIVLTSLPAKTIKALGTTSGGLETLSTQTQAQLIGSSAVAARVSQAIHGRLSTDELARAVDAKAISDHVIEIWAVDASPELARAEANAFADAYLAYRMASAAADVAAVTKQIADQKAGLQARIADTERAIEQASASLVLLPPVEQSDAAQQSTRDSLTADQAQATAERTRLMNAVGDLNLQEADLAGATGSPGQVVTRATLPTSPAAPGPLVVGLAGLVGGLMLGMVGALLRDRLGERVGSDDDAWAKDAPPIARLPRVVGGTSGASGLLAGAVGQPAEAVEAYRTLRETLARRGLGERHRILLVTSPGRREGKSVTAANLAVALAQTGLSVVAVSADLRRPRLAAFFGVKDQPGLTDVLKGSTTLAVALQTSRIPNLRVLPTAPERATGSDLLATPAFARMLRSLADDADVVMVDAAGVADGADAAILAGLCGASLLVVQDGVTLAGAAARAVQALSRAGAPPLGTVVSPAPPTSAPVRVAVAGLSTATVLLGSVVWASTASVRGTPDTGLAAGSTVSRSTGTALAPNTGLPQVPDLAGNPAEMADLEAKVAPLEAAAPDPTAAAREGGTTQAAPARNGKAASGRNGTTTQTAGGPGGPAAAPGNPAAVPAPVAVPPVPGPGPAPLPPPATGGSRPAPSPTHSHRPRPPSPSASPTARPRPTPAPSPSRRPTPPPSPRPTTPRPPSPQPTTPPAPSPRPTTPRPPSPRPTPPPSPRPTTPPPSPRPTTPRPPSPRPTSPPPPSPRPTPSPTSSSPSPPWWWPWPPHRPGPRPRPSSPPAPSQSPSSSNSGSGSSQATPSPSSPPGPGHGGPSSPSP